MGNTEYDGSADLSRELPPNKEKNAPFKIDSPPNQGSPTNQLQSQEKTSVFGSTQTAKQLTGSLPKYLVKEDFGLKFQF